MRFIDASTIREVLTFPILIDAIEAAHRRPKIEIADGLFGRENEHYFVRHAVDRGRFFASKLITSFPANLESGMLPAVQAVCVLFDGKNGEPLCVIDGTELTYWRTAADSALGAKLLAPASPKTLLVVGAGEMSSRLVRAHLTVRPSLQRILIWNRSHLRATFVADTLAREGLPAETTTDLDEATALADIVTACTRSHVPLIKGANLKSGAHVDLVGGYTENTREADDEAVRKALIFVDRRESACMVGDVLQPIASGVIANEDVLGDLYDLVAGGNKGRTSGQDITLFKNAGGGHFDLIAAEAIFRLAGGPR